MDKLLEKVGSFGKFQKLILIIIGTSATLSGLTVFMSVFNNAIPAVLCTNKQTSFKANETFLNNVCQVLENITKSKETSQETPYECSFDTKYYGKTIVTEWNLLCDRLHLATITQTVYMIGSFSSLCVGYFSDRYGRKRACVFLTIILTKSLLICEFFQLEILGLSDRAHYIAYLVAQYFIGFSQFGLEICIFILFIEMANSKYSNLITVFFINMFALGELLIVVISYFMRDWHYHNLTIAAYSFLNTILISFFLPESPRFLIQKENYKEAAIVLSKIAKINGNQAVTENDILKELGNFEESKTMISLESSADENKCVEISEKNNFSIRSYLFSQKKNFSDLLFLANVWFSNAMLFYGMNYGVTSISKHLDPYLMFSLSSLAEIIGFSSGLLFTQVSRRKLLIIYFISAIIPLLMIGFIPPTDSSEITLNNGFIMLFAFIGKAQISACFYLVYHYTPQIFPTNVRNTLISFVSCIGRFGSLSASQVNLLRFLVWGPLPYFLFALNAILAAISMWFLPNEKTINRLN